MIEAKDVQPGVVYVNHMADRVEILYRSKTGLLVAHNDGAVLDYVLSKEMTFTRVQQDKRVTLDKKYTTRNGDPVRILAIDLAAELPVAAAITGADGREVVQQYYARGTVTLSEERCDLDLVEASEYEAGQLLECRTFIGWRAWYSYVSQLEPGVHLVRMDVTPEDADPEDKYSVFKSQDIRPRGKEIETE